MASLSLNGNAITEPSSSYRVISVTTSARREQWSTISIIGKVKNEKSCVSCFELLLPSGSGCGPTPVSPLFSRLKQTTFPYIPRPSHGDQVNDLIIYFQDYIENLNNSCNSLSLLYNSIHASLSLYTAEQMMRHHPHHVQSTYISPSNLHPTGDFIPRALLLSIRISLISIGVLESICL